MASKTTGDERMDKSFANFMTDLFLDTTGYSIYSRLGDTQVKINKFNSKLFYSLDGDECEVIERYYKKGDLRSTVAREMGKTVYQVDKIRQLALLKIAYNVSDMLQERIFKLQKGK